MRQNLPTAPFLEIYVAAFLLQFLNVSVQTHLVNRPQRSRRYLDVNPVTLSAIQLGYVYSLLMQVWQKTAFGFRIGMRNTVSRNRTLPG